MRIKKFVNESPLNATKAKKLLHWTAAKVGVPNGTEVHLALHSEVPVFVGFSRVGPAPYYGDTQLAQHRDTKEKRIFVRLAVSPDPGWYPIEPDPYFGEESPITNTPEENLVALAAHELTHVRQHATDHNMFNGVSVLEMEQQAVRESHRVLAEFRKQNKVRIPDLSWYSKM